MKKALLVIISIIFSINFFACKSSNSTITVYTPDGAPALGVVSVIDAVEGVDVKIVGADVIATNVTGKNPKADVCVLPINLAVKLLGSGEEYKMLGTVTHGNFYFLSEENTVIDLEKPSELKGLTIGVIQLANIPGLTLKSALNELNIPYNELKNDNEVRADAVNLKSITASEIGAKIADIYMLPSPVADAKAKNGKLGIIGSLQSLYGGDFPQAVVVAKNSVILNNKAKIKAIINKMKGVDEFLAQTNIDTIISLINGKLESGLTPTFNKNNLDFSVISNCNVRFESSLDAKQKVINFTQKIHKIAPNSIVVPKEDFFITEEL